MPQYFLAVNHDEAGAAEMAAMTMEDMQPMFEAVGAFNDRAAGAGRLGLRRRPAGPRASTVVDATGDDAGRHRRPVLGVQGVPRRLLDHRGRRPRRRARLGHEGLEGLRGQGRGPPLPGRARGLTALGGTGAVEAIERVYREEFGRVVASLTRRFGDIDVAEDAAGEALAGRPREVAGRRRAPQPGGVAHHHRRAQGHRPDPPRVPPRRQAPGRPRCSMDDTPHEPTGAGRGRPAPDGLHLLPPRARPRGAGGPDPAAARRPDASPRSPRRSWCPRRRWPSGSPGPRRRSPAPASPSGCPSPADLPERVGARPGRGLPGLQRGLPVHRGRARRCATTSPPRRSGSAGSCTGCCPTTPRSPACSP